MGAAKGGFRVELIVDRTRYEIEAGFSIKSSLISRTRQRERTCISNCYGS